MSIETEHLFGKVGRPRTNNPRDKRLVLMLTSDELERLETLAGNIGRQKSVLARSFLLAGLEEGELFYKTGLLKPLVRGWDLFSDWREGKKKELKDRILKEQGAY